MIVWLEDSSKVTLQPKSKLDIPKAFANHTEREVKLIGEAVFEVTKDPNKPFLVHTGDVVTRVLGTSFRIIHTSQEANIEVEVLTGKVSVYNEEKLVEKYKKSNGVVLTPNQKVTYYKDNQHFVTSVVDVPLLLPKALKERELSPRFIYKETPIEVVIGQLEQNYGIHIVVDNERFNNCPLTANLSEQPLFSKLAMICTSLNATYEVKGTTILINGRGCN